MADPTARVLAVQRLLRVEADGAHTSRLADGSAPPEVSRRAVDYVSGVTRQKRWLDWVLAQFVRGRLYDFDPELLQILRIAAYEILEKEVAPHAAVNEAVETAKAMLHRGAASLTNGVLRALVRARNAGHIGVPDTGDLADDLAVQYSHPTWPVRRWLDRWGEDATRRFLVETNDPGRYALRVTSGADAVPAVIARLADIGVEAEGVEHADDFVRVDRLQPVLRGGLIAEGVVAVQDVAAGLVVRVLDPQPGDRVLDAAAAPGGKTIYSALRMGTGDVVALDLTDAKRDLIARAARQQGADIVRPVVGDLRTWVTESPFDRVLLDAPCSGSGVLARRADLRWRRTPQQIEELAVLQDELLDAAVDHVAPGGLLVYSTCSVEPEENDDRVAAFLDRHPEYDLEPVAPYVPPSFADGDVYRALPHVHGTDGAFAARLRRDP